jgi:hypothetical protein
VGFLFIRETIEMVTGCGGVYPIGVGLNGSQPKVGE